MKSVDCKGLFLGVLTAIALGMAFSGMKKILTDPQLDLYYSHLPLIPVISAYLLFRKRKGILNNTAPPFRPALIIMAVGVGLFVVDMSHQARPDLEAMLGTLAAIVFFLGSFLFLYGVGAARKAYFPLAFLVFAIPVPSVIMDSIVSIIAVATTHVTEFLFALIKVPFVRVGSVFHLPGFSLEIGPECAGLRSSIALLIISILAGHLFLRGIQRKVLLAALVFPLAIIKNGVRVVILYFVSYFIDERFMEGGFLHRSIGYGLFFVALMVLWLIFRPMKEITDSEQFQTK